MALTKKQESLILEAVRKIDIFCDPEDPRCMVSKEAREESRLYVETWVGGPLYAILGGGEKDW